MWFLKDYTADNWAWAEFLNKEDCNRLVHECKFDIKQAAVGKGIDKTIRDSHICWLKDTEKFEWIYRKCTDLTLAMNEKFFRYDIDFIEDLQFTVYDSSKGDQMYGKHIDTMTKGLGKPRKLSFSVQLSDPSDYEGGDLVIVDGENSKSCPKERGKAIFFPSYMLHEVKPVTKGVRYSLVGWVCGPPFK